jgi:hypothetical protein
MNPWEVVLTGDTIDRCKRFGEKAVKGYEDGNKPNSLALSIHGAEKDVQLFARSRMAEVAVCQALDLDDLAALNWSDRADPGYDLQAGDRLIDVKSCDWPKRLLLWPAPKAHFIDTTAADTFILVRVKPPTCYLSGWISKADFIKGCAKAEEGNPMRLIPGTLYMDMVQLKRLNDWGVS